MEERVGMIEDEVEEPVATDHLTYTMSTELASALQRLANYRIRNCRASQDIFESGVVVFRNNALHKFGEDSEHRT